MEVNELSTQGRIFTAFLIMGGVGGFVYIAGAFAQVLIDGRLQIMWGKHKMMKEISKLRDHFIVCGHGRIGSIVAQEILNEGHDVVVIEQTPELIEKMEQEGILCMMGDATSDKMLLSAGLMHAKSLISALTSEAANVYVTLTARQLNPDINIVARAGDKSHISRLELAGADRVVLPHLIGGLRMAQSVLRPTVTNFVELAVRGGIDLQMEELEVTPSSELVSQDLIESKIRPRFNLIIIAIKKGSGEMVFNPGPKEVINAYDTLLAVGTKANLAEIKRIL
jgi:voltage-gated potassium channel